MRQCKDDVKVDDRKQFMFAGLNPSFSGYSLVLRTMLLAAGMVDNAFGASMTAAQTCLSYNSFDQFYHKTNMNIQFRFYNNRPILRTIDVLYHLLH